ncbi:MAG: MFS transporter [Gemmataceae bacterium]
MSDATPPANRSALGIVFLVVVIDLLGFGIVLPLLPLFATTYVETVLPGQGQSGAGGAIVGLLMASFSAMQFVFAPVWGRVSDRVGRRPILLLGLAGSVVFYTLFGYASDLPAAEAAEAKLALALLFVARIGAGIAGATIATPQAVIADCTPPERRKQGMALIGFAFGIGFTFGPLVGFAALYFFPAHKGAIGVLAALLSLVALVLCLALMPETRNFTAAPSLERKWLNLGATRAALTNPAIGPVVLTFFLASLGFASFEVTLSLLNRDALGLQADYNFLVFTYVGFVLGLTQGFLYKRVARTLDEPSLMAIGITLMGLGVLALGGVTWAAERQMAGFPVLLAMQLSSLTIAVVGFAFLTPSAQALISRRSDPSRQGEVLGVNQSASALARILGPIFGLTLYSAHPTHLLPYVAGAALVLLMLPLIPRIRRAENTPTVREVS